MPSKAELQEEAKNRGIEFNSNATKAELEQLLDGSSSNELSGDTQDVEQVQVNQNDEGEATNGTTKQGSEAPVENTENVPQNGETDIQTTEESEKNPVAEKADASRTEEEVKFADESNPNQKARNTATQGQEFDQDGNPRTGGKSYGTSADDTTGIVHDPQNDGQEKEGGEEAFTGRVANDPAPIGSYLNPEAGEEGDTNNTEWSVEDQQKVEESLSQLDKGVRARVVISAGNYVKIKFLYNNKPLGSYKSRDFNEADAASFRDKLVDQYVASE